MFNRNVFVKFLGRPAKLTAGEFLTRVLLFAPILLPMAMPAQSVTLPDHVLGILPYATPLSRTPQMDSDPLTVCVMLNLSDQAGFDAFEKDFNDPNSPSYHNTINAADLTARFGPTQEAYDTVLAYLQQSGFTLAVGSANRLTITVHGTRAQTESVFHVSIDDYVLGDTTFHANATDPAIPQSVAPLIRSVVGLSNLYQPKPAGVPVPNSPMAHATAYDGALTKAGKTNTGGLPPGLNGTGQSIGLIEYDNYNDSDVTAWISLVGLPAKTINRVSRSPINGGRTASNGRGTTEVLLDIDAALGIAQGANILVFVTPYATDTLTTLNAAINQMNAVTGGVGGILSSSWGSTCELAASKAEANSLDVALQTAALSGLTFFVDSADGSAICAGAPKGDSTTGVHYPSNVPHAVAVGGTTLSYGPNSSYGGETWWNASSTVGGSFGVSTFFTRPSYQKPYTSASGRSVPDISADAGAGIIMCQASVSSSCFGVGGTSLATPIWASVWAITSQAMTDAELSSVSASGDYFYKMPTAFHAPSTMTGPGNDFAHVGLGSPDIAKVAAMAVADALKVESVSPDSGPGAGGTTVTITGKGFIGVEKVTFGGVDAKNVTIYSDSKLTAGSPAAASDQVDIRVVTPGGETPKSGKDVFSYDLAVTKVSPDSGPLTGGITVTVTGHRLADTDKFDFGGSRATSVACASTTQCTMVVPSHSAASVDVIVETGKGNSPTATADRFTYFDPAIKGVSPSVGPTVGGQSVTITGVGFDDAMIVKFGSTPALSVSCLGSTTSCTVVSPAGAGQPHINATLAGVTSTETAADVYTYAIFPSVASITPYSGPVTGGVAVTITGTNFSTTPGGTTFQFGSLAGTGVSCSSSTQCSATAPVRDPSAGYLEVPVTATVNGYTSFQVVNFQFGTPTPPPPPPPCKGTACR
jgi:hypothetical protein